MNDIRDDLFRRIERNTVIANISADADCILSGVSAAVDNAQEIGLKVNYAVEEGYELSAGDLIMQIEGSPKQITIAEDNLIGLMAKTSGIATASKAFVDKANGRTKIICGAAKKMPYMFKTEIRKAIVAGGASHHICDEPMVYMDKNYVRMLGSIRSALQASEQFENRKKVIQIHGDPNIGDIVREAWEAVHGGADIVFIDTGKIGDAERVLKEVKPTLAKWEEEFQYRKVMFAYAGGVRLSDIDRLCEMGIDAIDIGRSIIDAPLADMSLDVADVKRASEDHSNFSLLDKSELKIENIRFSNINLNKVAEIVAEEIGVSSNDVLVIDVRDGEVALDVLQKQLDPHVFVGKEQTILSRLSKIEGITISENTHITSRGMLGWIVGDPEEVDLRFEGIERAESRMDEIMYNISRRALIFASGAEVENREIEDTNSPLLMSKLSERGFKVDFGGILKDDIDLFTGGLRRAMNLGYGLIITTGGVGAEDKDFSVEAIERLDETAATPYIVRFQQGHGRHSKDGIRIGVGRDGITTFVALPGPNDEVALCVDTVIEGIEKGWSKEVLAARLAMILRGHLRMKMGLGKNHNNEHHEHDHSPGHKQ